MSRLLIDDVLESSLDREDRLMEFGSAHDLAARIEARRLVQRDFPDCFAACPVCLACGALCGECLSTGRVTGFRARQIAEDRA